MFRIVLGKKISGLLQILDNFKQKKNSLSRLKEISSNPEEEVFAAEYLRNNNFADYTPYARLFEAEITIKDIYEVDYDNKSTKLNIDTTLNIDQSKNVRKTPETIINSDNFIKNHFKDLYKTIDESEYKNKEKIKEKVEELEKELHKENINKIKIHYSMEWLKENAEEIRDIAVKIVASVLTGFK
jgi:hypothetical protein